MMAAKIQKISLPTAGCAFPLCLPLCRDAGLCTDGCGAAAAVRRVPLGKAHALAFPVLLMQLLMDEGPGMAPLIDPVHPDHRAVGVDGGGLGRLVERAALRTEIIGIIIVGLTALIASHFAHNATRPFISLPV